MLTDYQKQCNIFVYELTNDRNTFEKELNNQININN